MWPCREAWSGRKLNLVAYSCGRTEGLYNSRYNCCLLLLSKYYKYVITTVLPINRQSIVVDNTVLVVLNFSALNRQLRYIKD